MEIRDLLTKYQFPGDKTPIIRGSATAALSAKPEGEKAIADLLDAVDAFIPLPTREVDKPFLMCIEDVFNIEGRGTVVTGRVERGELNKMSEVEIVGLKDTRKTTATDIEMFRKLLDKASAGDNVGVLLRGTNEIVGILEAAENIPLPDGCHLYVLFCENNLIPERLAEVFESVPRAPEERLIPHGREAFWIVPKGMTLDSAFGSKVLGSRQYKSLLTSRNVNTVAKIGEAMK
jgi:uncharacterized protein (DUF1697 family)